MLSAELQKISAAKEQYDQAVAQAAGGLKQALQQAVSSLPEDVVKIQWMQYTPYFNDGDACVFQVNDVYFFTAQSIANAKEERGEDYDEDDWPEDAGGINPWGEWGVSDYAPSDSDPRGWSNKQQYNACKEIDEFISKADDLMLAAFGDHAKITITREEITVEEYDHD